MPAVDDTGGFTILKRGSVPAFPLWVADMYLSKQKRNCMLVLALRLGAGVATLPATAQQHQQSEHHHAKQKWPQATLQAEANAEIAQDTVKITLAAELSDTTQTAVADALTKTLQDTMAQAKADRKSTRLNSSH